MFPPDTPRPINTPEAWRDEYETCRAWDSTPQKVPYRHPFLPLDAQGAPSVPRQL